MNDRREIINSFYLFRSLSPSRSTDSAVGPTRRRVLKDEETPESSFNHSTIPKYDSVVSTEDADPGGKFNSAQLPKPNNLGKQGLKRRVVEDEDYD